MGFLDELVGNTNVQFLYYATVLVLLVLMVFYLKELCDGGASEHLTRYPLGTSAGAMGAFTSGASQRHTQLLSDTSQENRQTPLTIDVAEQDPSLSGTGRPVDLFGSEHLVSNRGEPDFWTVGSELGAYKRRQVPGMRSDAAAKEHMTVLEEIRMKEDARLLGGC